MSSTRINLANTATDLDEMNNRIIALYADGKELVAWAALNLTPERLAAGDLLIPEESTPAVFDGNNNLITPATPGGMLVEATAEQLTALQRRIALLQQLISVMESTPTGLPDTIVNLIRKTRTRFRG